MAGFYATKVDLFLNIKFSTLQLHESRQHNITLFLYVNFNIFHVSEVVSYVQYFYQEHVQFICEKQTFLSLDLSLCPHLTSRLLLFVFLWTFISEDFTKVCVKKIQDSLQSDKNNGYFT
jgi:hypothetical protein